VTLFLLMAGAAVSESPALRLAALALLGSLPVYDRTFAFVRGEPELVFFAMVTLDLVARINRQPTWNLSQAAALGLCLSLVLLSRQSGISLVLAVVLFLVALGSIAWSPGKDPEVAWISPLHGASCGRVVLRPPLESSRDGPGIQQGGGTRLLAAQPPAQFLLRDRGWRSVHPSVAPVL
jgi:hypothetical protein